MHHYMPVSGAMCSQRWLSLISLAWLNSRLVAAALTEGFSFMCVLAEGFSMPWVVETVTALAPGWESELNGDKGFLQPCGFGHCTFQRGVITHDCIWCQTLLTETHRYFSLEPRQQVRCKWVQWQAGTPLARTKRNTNFDKNPKIQMQ